MEHETLIQVFGLRRSGTNLIERMVLDHFDPSYQMIPVIQNLPNHIKYGQPESLKHTIPNLDYSKFAIVIFKPYEEWSKSILKQYGNGDDIVTWQSFHIRALFMFYNAPERVIIADWYDVATNYKSFVKYVSNKFGLSVKNIKAIPKYKMGRLSGTNLLDEQFEVKPYGDCLPRETLQRLNEVKWMT